MGTSTTTPYVELISVFYIYSATIYDILSNSSGIRKAY